MVVVAPMELELGKSVESEESSSSNNEHLPSDNDVIDLVKFAFLFQVSFVKYMYVDDKVARIVTSCH